MKKPPIKRFAIQPRNGAYLLYFLNRFGYVVQLGNFDTYGAALWFLHDVKGDTELMGFERLCNIAVGVQSCFADLGVC